LDADDVLIRHIKCSSSYFCIHSFLLSSIYTGTYFHKTASSGFRLSQGQEAKTLLPCLAKPATEICNATVPIHPTAKTGLSTGQSHNAPRRATSTLSWRLPPCCGVHNINFDVRRLASFQLTRRYASAQ